MIKIQEGESIQTESPIRESGGVSDYHSETGKYFMTSIFNIIFQW
jgi:hypothetical protein